MAWLDRVLARFTIGGRLPGGVGIILALTIVTSLAAALGSHSLASFFELGALVPERVLHGELWRLLTWSVIEPSPLALLFACLLLYWFGRDLAQEWGSRRFFTVYFAVAMSAGVGTCVLALFDGNILNGHHLGSVPLAEAITIAWGLWFPRRIIRIYFVIPIKGSIVAWGTVALTVVYAVYYGWAHYVPSLLAEGSMLAWLHRAPLVARWARWQGARAAAARQKRARSTRERTARAMATVHVLHPIEEKDADLPPLPREIEDKLGRILEDAAREQRRKRDDDGRK